ncbi:inosine triphosphate pyrophosphatase-like protein [Pelagophyceae sp. CCMP2097]|nr:inosine triphosphate pyrophosphatase-like protein [Pelagophyceae sp. CCMP2097]
MWLGAVTCAVGAASPLAAALVAATWLCDHDGRTPRKRDPAPKALFRRVAVGSTNPCKNRAVSAAFRDYDFGKPSVHAYEVDSGVSEQPLSLDLTAAGARNRAWRAHSTCVAESGEAALGVGIESGLFSFQGTWFDVCVVSLFDGARHAVGLSCAFEIPPAVARAVFEDGLDLSKAAHAAGLAGRDDIGQDEGLIAILTSDRVNREKYTTQAIQMALVRLEHPLFYLEG